MRTSRPALAEAGSRSSTTTSTSGSDAGAGPRAAASAGSATRRQTPRTKSRFRYPMVRPVPQEVGEEPAATMALRADVAELVDAHGSGPCGGDPVEVQVLSSA